MYMMIYGLVAVETDCTSISNWLVIVHRTENSTSRVRVYVTGFYYWNEAGWHIQIFLLSTDNPLKNVDNE